MDPNVVLAVSASLTSTVASALLVVFYGGRQVGRIEAAVSRLLKIEARLGKVDEIETKIGTVEAFYRRLHSDHQDLKRRIDSPTELSSVKNE